MSKRGGGCYAFWANVEKVSEYKYLNFRVMWMKLKLDQVVHYLVMVVAMLMDFWVNFGGHH